MRRAVLAAALVLALIVGPATVSAGQDPPPTTGPEQVPTQDIVPEPDSGEEPTEAGDRGGSLQLGLLAVIVAGVGLVGYLAYRESARARASRDRVS